ncbi:MAG TPA: type II toxin-antitoxin system PemK/MazF family toxin [Microthrixaceae bacterium]|nr:type II toxin-antitoxin system PemK/MazF family toxin [Microthrixaceae bacterium]
MISRGDLWWVELGEPRGSGPGLRRPALVVSSDAFNRSRIATVTVVMVSSNLRLAEAPGNVGLARSDSRLDKDSVINVSQVATLDKTDLVEWVGPVDLDVLEQVERGFRLSLAL